VDRATKEAKEVDHNEVLRLAGPSDIKSPQQLTALVKGLYADTGRHVCEGRVLKGRFSIHVTFGMHTDTTYCLAFGPVLEEGHAIIERCAELIQCLKLLFGVPDIVKVITSQSSTDGEADQGVSVAHTEPLSWRLGECGNVASE
jgi:hypothetical protein